MPPADDAPLPRPAVDPRWRPLAVLVGGSVLLYLPLVGYRWDYLAHFVIGAGLALVLTALATVLGLPVGPASALAVAAVVGGSVLSEQWWFGQLVYDWADVGAGGLGAAAAAAGVVAARPGPTRGATLGVGLLLSLAGLALRVGTDST